MVVIAGRERGKSGKVLSVDRSAGKVIVEKLNIIKRHTKPNQKVKQGGILEKEAPLAISNVMFLCPVTKKPTRLGIRVQLDDGRRVRFSKKIQRIGRVVREGEQAHGKGSEKSKGGKPTGQAGEKGSQALRNGWTAGAEESKFQPRLRDTYRDRVVPALMKEFGYKNVDAGA